MIKYEASGENKYNKIYLLLCKNEEEKEEEKTVSAVNYAAGFPH